MIKKVPLVLNEGGVVSQLATGDTITGVSIDGSMVTPMASGESTDVIPAGSPVYCTDDGKVKLAKADSDATYGVFGYAQNDIAPGATGDIQVEGMVTLPSFATVTATSVALSPGRDYFLSATTAGRIHDAPPDSGYMVKVGKAFGATK